MTNNQLAENSITQLLNSVKLARDNAERDDNRVDHSFYYALAIALEELQERRKAAMDSEPVAWLLSGGGAKNVVCFDSGNAYTDPLREVTPLYRHAQPAPVVPDERDKTVDADDHPLLWRFNEGWSACRAAMLQAGNSPVIPEGSASMLRRWLAFGRGMQNAGSQLPRNLIAETESMLAAAPQEVNHG